MMWSMEMPRENIEGMIPLVSSGADFGHVNDNGIIDATLPEAVKIDKFYCFLCLSAGIVVGFYNGFSLY